MIKKKKVQKKKKNNHLALHTSSEIIKSFSAFLVKAEVFRKASPEARKLVSAVFTEWGKTAAKDKSRKHQANLIKEFAYLLN